jgi:hypothetical protein
MPQPIARALGYEVMLQFLSPYNTLGLAIEPVASSTNLRNRSANRVPFGDCCTTASILV